MGANRSTFDRERGLIESFAADFDDGVCAQRGAE